MFFGNCESGSVASLGACGTTRVLAVVARSVVGKWGVLCVVHVIPDEAERFLGDVIVCVCELLGFVR